MYRQSEKNLLNSNTSSTCSHNMVNFGKTAEICWRVRGTPSNFNGFRVLAALLHGTLVVGVSQTLCGVEQRAPPTFGRATITLGIGPHSSLFRFCFVFCIFDYCLSFIFVYTSADLANRRVRNGFSVV